jgi:hypothetical protein
MFQMTLFVDNTNGGDLSNKPNFKKLFNGLKLKK